MGRECLVDIDALELSDNELRMLNWARYFGLTQRNGAVDSLADGGAQLILSCGRDMVRRVYPEGAHHKLTAQDLTELNTLLDSRALRGAVAYAATLPETMSPIERIEEVFRRYQGERA